VAKLHRHNTIDESVIKRKKDQEVFDYSSIVKDAWYPVIKAAQDFQNINFDLENNDPMSTKKHGSKRTIFIKKNLRVDQPIKYEINLELMSWRRLGDTGTVLQGGTDARLWDCQEWCWRIYI